LERDGELIEALRALGTDRAPHGGGRSLFAHLVGTERVTAAWQQPAEVRRAALFHSIYGTDAYQLGTLRLDERERVRALAGPGAERLAFLFCTLSRADLHRQLNRFGSSAALDVRRHGSEGSERVEPREIFGLVVLHMANLVEQARADDGGPGRVLAALGRMARHLGTNDGTLPPLVAWMGAALSDADEAVVLREYRDALDLVGTDGQLAAERLRKVVERCAWLAEPHAWLALLARARGDAAAAGHARRAVALRAVWGTAWDKRLDGDHWATLLSAAGAVHL
jgi:hypothetical protein